MLRTSFAAAVIAAYETGITWEMWGNPIKAAGAWICFWIMTLLVLIGILWPEKRRKNDGEI